VASKIDIVNKDKLAKLKRYCKNEGLELFPISAVTGKGIDDLMYAMAEKIEEVRLQTSGGGPQKERLVSARADLSPEEQRSAK
jgi:50S ribosomal subunit-associated GTPase HflX